MPLPLRLGHVNCYVIETSTGYVLIDTGASNSRSRLLGELEGAGCKPGRLALIIITHGDFDHIGNAAHIRRTFVTKIAMHHDDSGMAKHGDMFWNRQSGNTVLRMMARTLFKLKESDRFEPDLHVSDGMDLSTFGIRARVMSIPGHSKGSIGILTETGDLFCGDLFENTSKPTRNPIMDNLTDCDASIKTLSALGIRTVYPGHGKPFSMETLIGNQRAPDKRGR